tara:strand:- start:315 stop:935 length:621 start_codon:yes stop_codon:yes gene_type:complete
MIIDFSKELHLDKIKILFSNERIKTFPPKKKIINMNQTHSSKISEVSNKTLYYKSTDGLLSNNINHILEISVADCLPIFVYNKKNFCIGVVHAGWKGLKKGIISNLSQALSSYDSLSDFKIFIGPSISQKNYEVKKDFLEYFEREHFLINDDKYYLDLKKIAVKQLALEGFKDIEVSKICTFENQNFHSFRRNGTEKRMRGYIYYE